MIKTTFRYGEGFIFEVNETQDSLLSKMDACKGSAMVEFNYKPAYQTDIKDRAEAIRYIMDRVESLISVVIGNKVHGICPIDSSTEFMDDGKVAVSHLIFQIQYR